LHSTKSQNARYAHERSEGRLDRRHQAELADSKDSLQMQMAIMQNDLAEKRMDYDRETARMDKRSAAIAQLMSGLGSLGGAFAL
jgi:ABC-type phosphate transport system auxiliary subunit